MNNKALKTLFTFNGIFVFAGSLLGPLYAVYVRNIDGNLFSVSLSWAIYLMAATFFGYLVSKIGDKIKEREYLLMTGYIVRAVVWVLYIFVKDLPALVTLQIFLGLGEAFGTPAFDSLFAEHLDENKHMMEYSDWKMVSNLVLALGTIAGGLIVSSAGFPFLFVLMAGLSLISFFGILFKPRRLL